MKNLRYLITVLALINAGLAAQASAAHHAKGATVIDSTVTSHYTPSKPVSTMLAGGLHTGNE